jgi:hypothetical protein
MKNQKEDEGNLPTNDVKSLNITNIVSSFVDNETFVDLMCISKRTAQSWRDKGLITFSQIGSKIYYTQEDINNFFKEHKVGHSNHKGGLRNGRG